MARSMCGTSSSQRKQLPHCMPTKARFSVFAVFHLRLSASIGADDYLRLWDLDLLRCAKQVPGRGLPAHVSNLLTLTTVPEMGLLVSQRPSGDVILHSLEANFSTFPRAIDTPVSCLTVVGQFLVTGDLNAPRIRLFSLPELKELTTAACPAPPLSLIPVGTETFASIDRSGRVSLWHAGGGTLDAQNRSQTCRWQRRVWSGALPSRSSRQGTSCCHSTAAPKPCPRNTYVRFS